MTKQEIEKMAAGYYAHGLWSAGQLAALVAKGRLSQAAYKRITGTAYKA